MRISGMEMRLEHANSFQPASARNNFMTDSVAQQLPLALAPYRRRALAESGHTAC